MYRNLWSKMAHEQVPIPGYSGKDIELLKKKRKALLPIIPYQDATPKFNTHINDLNEYCLRRIFSLLPICDRVNLVQVNEQWEEMFEVWPDIKKLDGQKSAWGCPKNLTPSNYITSRKLQIALDHCGCFLNEIVLSFKSYLLDDFALQAIGKSCPNLEILDVTGFEVSANGLRCLSRCEKLKELSIGSTYNLCDFALGQIFEKNPKLRYLKLLETMITGQCFARLPKESIEKLSLSAYPEGVMSWFYANRGYYKSLHTLDWIPTKDNMNCNSQADGYELYRIYNFEPNSFVNVKPSIETVTNLILLDVSFNLTVNDRFFIAVQAHCKQLQFVNVSGCHLLTKQGLDKISKLPNLRGLEANYLVNITTETLLNMNRLELVSVHCCPEINNMTIVTLLAKCKDLKCIDLSGCLCINNNLVELLNTSITTSSNNEEVIIVIGGTKMEPNKMCSLNTDKFVFLYEDLSNAFLRPIGYKRTDSADISHIVLTESQIYLSEQAMDLSEEAAYIITYSYDNSPIIRKAANKQEACNSIIRSPINILPDGSLRWLSRKEWVARF